MDYPAMDSLSILLAIAAIAVTVYYFCFRGLNHFKSHGIDHPPAWPIFGNSISIMFQRVSIADYTQSVYNTNPEAKYVGMYEFMTPVLMIRDPELIKSIAVKNFDNFTDHRVLIDETIDPLFGKNLLMLRGERWRGTRNLLSPAFTSSKMKTMFKLMEHCGENFAEFMKKEISSDGEDREMKDVFTRFTNDVIATCAFGISVDSLKDPTNEFYVFGKEATNVNRRFQMLKFFCIRFFPFLKHFVKFRIIDDKCRKYFKNVIRTTIDTRDEQDIRRPDMIQLMMDSREKKEDFTIDDMTAQAFIFFFGGFESSASAMSFVAHELAMNQDVQETLQKEIDRVMEKSLGRPSYEDINAIKYLEAVINESLRMYPVLPQIDRACVKSFELPPPVPGGKPYVIEKGASLLFPIYPLQRDPKYFKDPNRFNPNRFMGENNEDNMSAYIPFGIGPRMCIANRFALLEVKVLIFHLCAKMSLQPCPKTNVGMAYSKKSFMVTSHNGFWIKLQPRKNAYVAQTSS